MDFVKFEYDAGRKMKELKAELKSGTIYIILKHCPVLSPTKSLKRPLNKTTG